LLKLVVKSKGKWKKPCQNEMAHTLQNDVTVLPDPAAANGGIDGGNDYGKEGR
jgi:hypothetical protein